MNDFNLVFYRKENGDCPVTEFLDGLNREMRYKMMQKLDYLELYGNHPKGDFTKPVGEGFFEVRAQNKTDISRIFFFFDKNRQIVLTNGFIKKTQRMPASELETAKRYRADYLARGLRREDVSANSSKKETVTSGPQWRPEFDRILQEAERRSVLSNATGDIKSKSKDGFKDK